jgi:3-methyladenine DNA glycosylase AlkD
MTAVDVQTALRAYATPEKAEASLRFFKTGPGQYGEGDSFIGITVPEQHIVARGSLGLPLPEVSLLLESLVHEDRLTAVFILKYQYEAGTTLGQAAIANFYLAQHEHINNWDIVDASAAGILGAHLYGSDRTALYELAVSQRLWDRRIAIVATHYFILHDDYSDTLRLAEILAVDREDLMHKAVGWMLREVGKRDQATLVEYLSVHYASMPRTTLRYAIERFEPTFRKRYLSGDV